jgi:endoglucanase
LGYRAQMSTPRPLLAVLLATSPLLALAACGSSEAPAPETGDGRERIRLDQVGYLPDETKVALVAGPTGASDFVVRATSGTQVLAGTLEPARTDPDSGDTVRAADFSALTREGSYRLEVPGVGVSHDFEIARAVYGPAFRLALRSFYGQRCGVAVDLAPSHPGYAHPACHTAGNADPDARFHASSGRTGTRDGARGWHDAGDYGKYVVNSGISTGELLWAFELHRARVEGVVLDIPESRNAVPDILDEARWNLEWMLTMQDADGGVWHKLTSERFGGFVMPHLDDAGPRYVIGTGAPPYKSSCATGDLAAVMAVAARVYGAYDAEFAGAALSAAERAWRWLEESPRVVFRNPASVSTGEYGDDDCGDERLWAAAELFRTTGRTEFASAFAAAQAAYVPAVGSGYPQDWGNVRNLAMFAYLLTDRPGGDAAVRARIRADLLAAADAIAARTRAHAYRVSLRPEDYVWGSNGGVANYGVLLLLADRIDPRPAYVQAARDNLHHLLGRNTFGLSWVTQLGDRPFRHPHHRPSGADTNAEPWPGLLSGGPNRYGGDPVIDAMPANPPARRYRDDQGSWASNENAINWNAALVLLLAGQLPDGER